MSSVTTQLDKGLFSTFLAIDRSFSADEGGEKPEEKPEQPAESEQHSSGFMSSRTILHKDRAAIGSVA